MVIFAFTVHVFMYYTMFRIHQTVEMIVSECTQPLN